MSSNFRVGGLASGMDIDQMVGDLIKVQRLKVDRIKQKRQQAEWQRVDFRKINSSLMTFRNSALNIRLQGTFLSKSVNSSNANAVTASANSSAANGSYSITVTNLAGGVTKGNQNPLADEKNADGTTKTLKEQFPDLDDNITFTLTGKKGADGITRNSHAFTIDTTNATIDTLVSDINKHSSSLGITASYDSANNRFFLTTNGTGEEYGIMVANDSDNLLSDAIGTGSGQLQLHIQSENLYRGQNALFSFGDVTDMESSTNTATVNGITLNLKEGGGATSMIAITKNVDAIYNSITAFMEQYNTTIDLIKNELSEELYKNFLPLTNEQREKLSEKQQESWEEKAKSGLLRNDTYLQRLTFKMRMAINTVVSNIAPVTVNGKSVNYNSMAAIGIITGQYKEEGKLNLEKNGTTLREAIENDLEGVMKIFTQNTDIPGEKGIAQRLYDEVNNGINGIIGKAGIQSEFNLYDNSFLGKTLTKQDKQIEDWEKRLLKIEDRYYKQFTAMEKALDKMNRQSVWLSNQFDTSKQ